MPDVSTVTTPQERLRTIVTEAEALNAKGVLDKADSLKMEELLTEGHAMRAQIERSKQVGDLIAFGHESGGMLPLSGRAHSPAMVAGATPAGGTVIDRRENGTVSLEEQYGEGIYAHRTMETINTAAYRAAFKEYLRTGIRGDLGPTAYRTLQEGADASGGFLVPAEVLERVIAKEPTPTRVAGRVTQLTTSRDNLIIPRVNYTTDDLYTTGMRITWTGEVPASSTAMRVTDPVFGQTHIPVYTAMMSIPLTNDMIEDSAFPLVSWIADKFGETVDLLKDNMIENGSGQGQPTGILLNPGDTNGTQPAVTVSGSAATLGSSDAVAAQNLIKFAYTLPEQYENGAVWVMNKTNVLQKIASLLDAQSRPYFSTGYSDSGLIGMGYMRRELLGMPIVLSGFMPNIGTSTFPIIFGDLRGYYLLNRIGFTIQVLRELYAETNQILLLGRIRFGGQTVEQWKLKVFQCHT